MSDHGLRGLRTCALAVPLAALLAAIGLGAPDGGAQSGGTYCDAAYCYVQTCERRPAPTPACRYVSERVCRSGRETGMHDPQRTTVSHRDRSGVSVSLGQRVQVGQQVGLQAGIQEGRGGPRGRGRRTPQPVSAAEAGSKKARPRRDRPPSLPPLSAGGPAAAAAASNKWAGRPNRPYSALSTTRSRSSRRQQMPRGNPKPSREQAPGAQPNGSNQPAQQCSWQMQNVCAPVAKQECRPVSKQVCNDYPEQSCYPRQVQDCHEERRQVCDPAQPPQEDCRRRPVQRPARLRNIGRLRDA